MMIIEQIYTGCLAQGAYYVQSGDAAIVIDPLREIQPYLDKAQRNGATIHYIFETHFHADFVSGHQALAARANAPIVYGPKASPSFECIIAEDGQEFAFGSAKIKVLHTPGHTLESSCYLLFDENNEMKALFTGDTLFIGDVGRPDLAQKSTLTTDDLAGMLYDSLRNKILPLPDTLIVYPAHGAGSACGKNMSRETFDTLGNQKKVNYALQEQTKAQFIEAVTDGLLPPPFYFPKNVMLNKTGIQPFEDVLEKGLLPLTPEAVEILVNEHNALVLDTRKPQIFGAEFVPRSINIGLDGDFAPWVGTLITDIAQPIVLITEEGRETEAITRLSRVGYDNILGYLEGGFSAWQASGRETDSVNSVSASDFASQKALNDMVIDVRKPTEFAAEHLAEGVSIPLAEFNERMKDFPVDTPFYVHCAGGYRSMIAASILKARGYHNLIEVTGGFAAIRQTELAVVV